jgi:hypothetical protein
MSKAKNKPGPGPATFEKQNALMGYYHQRRPELVKTHLGKFLVIAEGDLKGSFDGAVAALEFALTHYREGEFIIKQVIDPDPDVHVFVNPYVRIPG